MAIALTWALSLTVTKSSTIEPDESATPEKSSSIPTRAAPACATMSKFVNTTPPLTATLNTREPACVQYVSAKYNRTAYDAPGVNAGTTYRKFPYRLVVYPNCGIGFADAFGATDTFVLDVEPPE